MGRPDTIRPCPRRAEWKAEQAAKRRLVEHFIHPDREELLFPHHLVPKVRGILGLRWHGITAIKDVARILEMEYDAAVRLVGFVMRSKHPVIRAALTRGLPQDCGVFLPRHKIKCASCNSQINIIPCVQCSPPAQEWAEPPEGYQPLEPVPTDHHPGTPEKVAVLTERLERGEYLFHRDDRALDYSWQTPYSYSTDRLSVLDPDQDDLE